MPALSTQIFAVYPELKQEIKELGLWYESQNRTRFNLYDKGQHRYVYWKPGKLRSDFEYRPYYVYTPAVRYTFLYGFSGAANSLRLHTISFVNGPRMRERRRVYGVNPNRQCLGGNPIVVYDPTDAPLSTLLENFWLTGMNMDYNLRGTFWRRLCRLEGHRRLTLRHPGYELFERWQDLTPEEVEALCSPKEMALNV